MPIKFSCPNCKKALTVKDHLAGKRAACPACKKPLTVPTPQAKSAGDELARQKDLEELAAAALTEEQAQAKVEEPKTIDFSCPQCDEAVKVPVEMQGKQAPCPSCRRIIKVPLLVKREKTDWRKADSRLPTGARRDTEPAPEGAWGSVAATLVSREALLEGAPPRRLPLTRRQKITRSALAVSGVAALGLAVWLGVSLWGKRTQEQAFAKASGYLDQSNKADLPREARAALHLAAGTYRFRSGSNDCAREASKSFQQARELLDKKTAGEADFLLTEQALALIEMGGNAKSEDVVQGRLLPWDAGPDNVLKQLSQTLTRVHPEAQGYALRKTINALMSKGQDKVALLLVRQVAVSPPGPDAKEPPVEIQAIAGLEFLRNGDKQSAGELATQAMAQAPANKEKVDDKHLPLSPSLVALCIALGKPGPAGGQENENSVDLKIGQAAGEALKGDAAKARAIVDTIDYAPDKWRAWVMVAAAAPKEASAVNEAISLVEGPLADKQLSPWLLEQLVEIGLEAGVTEDRLHSVAKAIHDPDLQGQAELEILRASLKKQDKAVPVSALESILAKTARLQAALELARHNARLDGGFMKEVETWQDEGQKAFGYMGIALGLQDKKPSRK
jgi:DNA-directed RNA polymerase subunit M/transcription elongation factor TFIIS